MITGAYDGLYRLAKSFNTDYRQLWFLGVHFNTLSAYMLIALICNKLKLAINKVSVSICVGVLIR